MSKKLILSLTGKDSHEVILDSAQGSFSIGTIGSSKGEFDAWVEENDTINWDAFNGFYVPASINQKDKYPYGDWPRWIYYSGNDMGFIKWSIKREIEGFYWFPYSDIKADFSNSNISRLSIDTSNKIELVLGNDIDYLELYGNLKNYKVKECGKVPSLEFWPKYDKNIDKYKLPDFDVFKDTKRVLITVEPNDPPFDCTSLLQFPNLEILLLIGNMTNLYALGELTKIKELGLWSMPNLLDFPHLDTWKELKEFIAIDIEEKEGKRLREELKELRKIRNLEYSTVSKLRDSVWFETYCGLPFSQWEDEEEKKAIRIYNRCLKEVKESKTEDDIKNAIINFTNKFNKFDIIESIERDDIYTALCKIMKNSPINISEKIWITWFDEIRNF